MVIGKRPQRQRRYEMPYNEISPKSEINFDIPKDFDNIQLPNIVEDLPPAAPAIRKKVNSSFLQKLTDLIGVEEIILIGLILLLVDEGVEDELLLIMLIYILIL